MGPSLSGRMLSLAIWHAATIHHGVPLVIEMGGGLPSRLVQAYHARVPLRHQSSRDGEQGATGSCPTSPMAAKGETMTAKKDKKARRLARKRKVQRRTPSSGQQ